ncbi:MAG TPA: glutaredoxin family protein [Candidatus Nanopelagicales bacterium]
MTDATALTLYGADWCPDCRRSKRLLDKLGVTYDYRDVETDAVALAEAESISGRQSIPVILFPGGHHVVEPSDKQLQADLATAGLLPG